MNHTVYLLSLITLIHFSKSIPGIFSNDLQNPPTYTDFKEGETRDGHVGLLPRPEYKFPFCLLLKLHKTNCVSVPKLRFLCNVAVPVCVKQIFRQCLHNKQVFGRLIGEGGPENQPSEVFHVARDEAIA